MSKITTPATGHELQLSSAPDFNDVCDELYGCRTAFDGMIELMTIAFLPELTGYKDAFAFILLIVVLLIKPTGLLGKNQGEKV